MRKPQMLPEEVEVYRDRMWCREVELRLEDPRAAERFIERVGFCAALADIRRPGPSLYIAVCGRRDAQMPRNVQKDPETSLAWRLKDQVMKRGHIYYGKILKGRSTFISRDLVKFFNSLLGISRQSEPHELSPDALKVLKVLRREWEMATSDLRKESRVTDRAKFARALDELQRRFKVIPSDVTYEPVFTYIWSVSEARFPQELKEKVNKAVALTEIARAYLRGAGMVERGELARVTGLSPRDAGLGHWALVDEEFAERLATGVYRLRSWDSSGRRAHVQSTSGS